MPTVRQILGDELDALKEQGMSDTDIIAIAKQRRNSPQQTPQTNDKISLGSMPDWMLGQSGNAVADTAGNVFRGIGKTSMNYMNLASSGVNGLIDLADDGGRKQQSQEYYTNILQKLDNVTEHHKAQGRDPEREAEVAAMNAENAKAEGFKEKLAAGASTLKDTVMHPEEWQLAETVGEMVDPLSLLAAGKTIGKAILWGALPNGAQAVAFDAPRTDKTGVDMAVDAILGTGAGAVMGGTMHLGGRVVDVARGKKPGNKKQESNENVYSDIEDGLGIKDQPVEGEVMFDPEKTPGFTKNEDGSIEIDFDKFDPVVLEAEIVQRKANEYFAETIMKEEQNAMTLDQQVKVMGQQMQDSGADPIMIEAAINEQIKPTPEALQITHVVNDGAPMSPRLSGMNMQQALINSINNPLKTKEQFYASMLKHGATDEHAQVATAAYESRDIEVYTEYATEKLQLNRESFVDQEKIQVEAVEAIDSVKEYQRFKAEELQPIFDESKAAKERGITLAENISIAQRLHDLYKEHDGADNYMVKIYVDELKNYQLLQEGVNENNLYHKPKDIKGAKDLTADIKQNHLGKWAMYEDEPVLIALQKKNTTGLESVQVYRMNGEWETPRPSELKPIKDIEKISKSNQEDIKPDQSFNLAHEKLTVEETRTPTQQGDLFGKDQQLFDVPSETVLKVPAWAKGLVNKTTRYEDIVREVTEAKNGAEPTPLAKRAMEAMAEDELNVLKQHERFDEALNYTREINAKDQVSGQNVATERFMKHENKGAGYETDVSGATYTRNYRNDFQLSKGKVKRIEQGKATLQDIEDLKTDLDMMENNPEYRLPTEEELRAEYAALKAAPENIYDFEAYGKMQERFDPEAAAEAQAAFFDDTTKETTHDTTTTGNLEQDSAVAAARNEGDAAANDLGRGRDNTDLGSTGSDDGAAKLSGEGDRGAPGDTADLLGEQGNNELRQTDTAGGDLVSDTADQRPGRSSGLDDEGVQPGREGDAAAQSNIEQPQIQSDNADLGEAALSLEQKKILQKEAELKPFKLNDPQNIHDTLPFLLEPQRQDVIKAEARFYEGNHKGMLFTNGTGTGKTFTGLGIVKRFARMDKNNIVVVAPTNTMAKVWIKEAKILGLKLRHLEKTTDAPKEGEMVVTTYEGMRSNTALQERANDLVVADESHKIMANQKGTQTANLEGFRKATGHYQHALAVARAEFAEQRDAAIKAKQDALGNDEAYRAASEKVKEINDAELQRAMEINARTKTVFLSASPFASHKSLSYADDYLFNFKENKWAQDEYKGYVKNASDDEQDFYIKNFGYQMKYNKLQLPDAEVNVDLMERTFSEKLKSSGAMSGRTLEVNQDYQRPFVLVSSEIGKKIDEGFERLNNDKELTTLRQAMRASYMDTVSLMESIKAKEAVGRIKDHLALGRKVVVYHTFVNNTPQHPFHLEKYIAEVVKKARKNNVRRGIALQEKLNAQYEQFKSKHSDLYNLDLGELKNPVETIRDAFGEQAVFFNGKETNKDRKAGYVRDFNEDKVDIFVFNESGKEGISLHDDNNGKQRAMINLTLPIKPIDMIQVEGRIFRTGQTSDAIFEYLTLHTNFEKRYFGSAINQRVATVENLALGENSRALNSAIKQGYMDAEEIAAADLTGQGGKAFDKRAEGDTVGADQYTYAKTLYFGQKKGRQNHRGKDYFATPEPLGVKMVEWADIQANERVLEPSAGHGAIGKWFPQNTVNHFVESSSDLYSDLSVAVQGKVHNMDFLDLDLHNKYDAIVMNPPYGLGSADAIKHIAKAMGHTNMGGRIVALAPNNMMDKAGFKKMLEDKAYKGWVLREKIDLPEVTFKRAGTGARTSVYILDKTPGDELLETGAEQMQRSIAGDDINHFFDELQEMSIDAREIPRDPAEIDAEISKVVSGMPIEVLKKKHTKTGEDMTVIKPADRLSGEDFKALRGEITKYGGYYSKFVRGFIFKDEAKAVRFQEDLNSGDVKLNAFLIPGAQKVADFLTDPARVVDDVYDVIANFMKDLDKNGVPKQPREASNAAHQMANDAFGWLRDNFVTGGGRSTHFLDIMREYTDMRGSIAHDAINIHEILSKLDKEESQNLVRVLGGDMDLAELNPKLHNTYNHFRKMIDSHTAALIEAGALDPKYAKEDYVKRFYFEHIRSEDPFYQRIFRSKANKAQHARQDLTLEERIEMGQVEDAAYVVAKTIMEQKDQLSKAKLFNKINEDLAYKGEGDAPEGYVLVPDTKLGVINKWGSLNGKYIPEQVFNDLRGAEMMAGDLSKMDKFLKAWVGTVQHIKTNMTVKNLGTHVYNAMSNVFVTYLDGHHTQLYKVLRDPAYRKQLNDEAVHFGLDSMLDDFEQVGGFKEIKDEGPIITLFKNLYMTEDSKTGQKMRTWYQNEDVFFKLAAYAKRKEAAQLAKFLEQNPEIKAKFDGGYINEVLISNKYRKDINKISLEEAELRAAFKEVDEVYVNYSTPLPDGVKFMDRSGLAPFLHYTWKSTPIFLKLMAKHPYKVAMLHAAAGSIGLSKVVGEQDERDKVTPEYMNNGFNALALDNFYETDLGYLNVGRAVPAMRFMNESPLSYLLGMDGGLFANFFGIVVQGRDNRGRDLGIGKYDSNAVKGAKRLAAITEHFFPPMFPVVPLVWRQKVDNKGNEVEGITDIVAPGGRYPQKLIEAVVNGQDKQGRPLTVGNVASQASIGKLQHIDKVAEGQKRVNTARRLYEREFNMSKSSTERAAAARKYQTALTEIKGQLPATLRTKLKINGSKPGDKKKVQKFVKNEKFIKL